MRARDYRVRIGLHKCAFQTKDFPIRVLGTIFEKETRRIRPSRREKLNKITIFSTVPELSSFRTQHDQFLEALILIRAESEETAFCVVVVVVVTSESQQSESSKCFLSRQNNSPSSTFLSKIFKEQQKLSDSDSLFANSYFHRNTGSKMLNSSQPNILIPPSLRAEIVLLTHGCEEAGHPSVDIA
ncbi:hypothetical protein P9112_010119 [Eukaryota sp. TZLM1-RC]